MPQSVTFQFSSPHFTFASGHVTFTKGARLFADGGFESGRMTNGIVTDVLVEGPIQFDAIFGDLTLIRAADGRTQRVGFGRLTGDLRDEDIQAGQITVVVNAAAVMLVSVVDVDGRPRGGLTVSLHVPDWEATLEATTDESGGFAVLAGPGRYDAKIGFVDGRRLWPPVENYLDITPADVGERRLLLRVPRSEPLGRDERPPS
jgi:hypothetical protein